MVYRVEEVRDLLRVVVIAQDIIQPPPWSAGPADDQQRLAMLKSAVDLVLQKQPGLRRADYIMEGMEGGEDAQA